jgi:hypothetical protein
MVRVVAKPEPPGFLQGRSQVNVPLGIIALAALLIYLPANISARSNDFTGWAAVRRIDFVGAMLSAAATVCLLLGLTWGSNATFEWSSRSPRYSRCCN